MAIWNIPIEATFAGMVQVEAKTCEEAMEIAAEESSDIPIPEDLSYIDGSWALRADDAEYIREGYNDNQEDEPENTSEDTSEDIPE